MVDNASDSDAEVHDMPKQEAKEVVGILDEVPDLDGD